MDVPFRMYVKQGCPACKEAIDFMTRAQLPCEWIDIGNDPVLNSGVAARGNKIPILVCFDKLRLIKGFEPTLYMQVITEYFARKQQGFEEVEAVPDESVPANGDQP